MCVSEFQQVLVFSKPPNQWVPVKNHQKMVLQKKIVFLRISEDFNQEISNMAENKDLLVKSHVEEHVLANANTAVCKIRDLDQSVTQTISYFKSLTKV